MYGQNKRKEEKEYGKKAVQLNNTSTEEEKDFEDLKRQARELNELYKTKTKPFSELLSEKLKEADKTMIDLADALSLSDKECRRIRDEELGKTGFPIVVAICLYLGLTLVDSEKLLNAKRYTLFCDNSYVQLCQMFIMKKLTIRTSNRLLVEEGLPTLTNEDWYA